MLLIDASVERVRTDTGDPFTDIFENIKRAGQTCYMNESKKDAIAFTEMLIERGHLSPLEFGAVYIDTERRDVATNFLLSKFAKVKAISGVYHIATNYRVIQEHGWHAWLHDGLTSATEHDERITFRIITSRSIANELVRHRAFSFCQQSQRYVNYAKKCGIRFVKPYWYADSDRFNRYLQDAEREYMSMIDRGYKPEQAREVLPNATATEIMMCGFKSDFAHFFDLRCASNAHKDMQYIANSIKSLI